MVLNTPLVPTTPVDLFGDLVLDILISVEYWIFLGYDGSTSGYFFSSHLNCVQIITSL